MDSNEPSPVDSALSQPTDMPTSQAPSSGSYVVVARRYRPQLFRDLIGQEQATVALSNAITTNRVGHAYLFTGARGVGKTSAARIFAKALNCVHGPAPDPSTPAGRAGTDSAGTAFSLSPAAPGAPKKDQPRLRRPRLAPAHPANRIRRRRQLARPRKLGSALYLVFNCFLASFSLSRTRWL